MFDPDLAVERASKDAKRSGRQPQTHLALALLDHLGPESDALPDVAADALTVAHRYWNQRGATAEELLAARVACWGFLDAKNGNSTTIEGRGDYLTRAVICVLYPADQAGEGDLAETAYWFRDFMAGAATADRG